MEKAVGQSPLPYMIPSLYTNYLQRFWLFALMGGFTVLCGAVLGCLLPDSFKNPTSAFLPNINIFNERELHILQTRVLLDDPMKGKKKKKIGLPAFKKAVCPLTSLKKHN